MSDEYVYVLSCSVPYEDPDIWVFESERAALIFAMEIILEYINDMDTEEQSSLKDLIDYVLDGYYDDAIERFNKYYDYSPQLIVTRHDILKDKCSFKMLSQFKQIKNDLQNEEGEEE
jgi:ABC-type glycerol-3-phosphate transport system substrate-binding protein